MKKSLFYGVTGAAFLLLSHQAMAGNFSILTALQPRYSPFDVTEFYDSAQSIAARPVGSILRIEAIQGPSDARSWRVLYVSETAKGLHVPASGLVTVPTTGSKKTKLPIVAWAHGTTGIARGCAPSLAPNPVREFTPRGGAERLPISVGIPYLNDWLNRGYAVVAPDYAGLGTDTVPHYLIGEDAARDILNLVRAANNIEQVNLSTDIAVFGSSQGGQAVLFAGEIGKTYAPELHIKSVVALAPASTLLVSPTGDEPELSSHSPLPYMIGVGFMDAYNVDQNVFTPRGLELLEAVKRKCVVEFYMDVLHSKRPGISDAILGRGDWVAALQRNNAGLKKSSTPIYIVQGTNDKIVPPRSTSAYLDRARSVGTSVTIKWIENAGHQDLFGPAKPSILAWIESGFSVGSER